MPSGIARIKGKPSFAYAETGGNPWHMLGNGLQLGHLTSREMIASAQLHNWDVQLVPAVYEWREETHNMGDVFAVVRGLDGQRLGTVGRRYHVLQNEEAFEAIDSWLPDGNVEYETAGALGMGESVFLLARIGNDFKVAGKDPIKRYALCLTSHDGSKALTIKLCDTRVVCANTVSVALRENGMSVSLRHTATLGSRIQKAREALGLVIARQEEMYSYFDQLAQMKGGHSLTEQVSNILMPKLPVEATDNAKTRWKKENDRFWELVRNSPTVDFAGGIDNRWGVFCAATEFSQWVAPMKGMDLIDLNANRGEISDVDSKRLTIIEKRSMAALEGTIADERQQVFNHLAKSLLRQKPISQAA